MSKDLRGTGATEREAILDALSKWIRQRPGLDPRNYISGWNDKGSGDVSDMHSYPGPGMRDPEVNRVGVLG